MKKLLLLISVFIIAFVLCGAVSATSSFISNSGKTISVKPDYVTSTLNDKVYITQKTGTYGYGYYGVVTTKGKDIKGNNINMKTVYFNKNNNYFFFKDFKYSILTKSNADGSWSSTTTKVTSDYTMTDTIRGKTFNGLNYSGQAEYKLYYENNQRLIKEGVINIAYYQNGAKYAKLYSEYKPTYKKIANFYNTIKETMRTKTIYTNGDTRNSLISTAYTRNSQGKKIGQRTYGTSSGKEKVNSVYVTYTGKIGMSTRYDPNDNWNENYVKGGYSETKTSTSATLVRRLPLEAV